MIHIIYCYLIVAALYTGRIMDERTDYRDVISSILSGIFWLPLKIAQIFIQIWRWDKLKRFRGYLKLRFKLYPKHGVWGIFVWSDLEFYRWVQKVKQIHDVNSPYTRSYLYYAIKRRREFKTKTTAKEAV